MASGVPVNVSGSTSFAQTDLAGQAPAIMDVATPTVERVLRESGYPRMIHGHTHRPARHVHVVDGRECERWVLNAWYEQGGYLRCDANGCEAHTL